MLAKNRMKTTKKQGYLQISKIILLIITKLSLTGIF